jgi:hypothetical protein
MNSANPWVLETTNTQGFQCQPSLERIFTALHTPARLPTARKDWPEQAEAVAGIRFYGIQRKPNYMSLLCRLTA